MCNLRCEYCYIKNRDVNNEFPYEWVEKIKPLFDKSVEKPRLIFFGGEPLIKIDLIKKIVENYRDDFIFQVVTNGTINFDIFMDEVYDKNRTNFDVQISWDGSNITRKTLGGSETSDIVYNTIIRNLEKGRILVGRSVLDDNSVYNFYQTYQIFKELNMKYKFGADFTIAHQPSFTDHYSIVLKEQLTMVLNDIKQSLFNDYIYIPKLICRWLYNYLTNINMTSCDVGNYIVIKPNGDVYPCTILSQMGDEFKLGNINGEIDTELCQLLKYDSKCKVDCKFKSICDGGCRYERIINYKKDWVNNVCKYNCDIHKSLYESLNKFIKSLNNDELESLNKWLYKFKIFSTRYDNCDSTLNNQQRLFEY